MMLIITKNGEIIGIEKKLLHILDTDLTSVSNLINALNLQLSSLTSEPVKIKNKLLDVKEIDLFSTDDMKSFDIYVLSEEKEIEIPLGTEDNKEAESFHFEPKIIEEETEPEITLPPHEEPFEETFLEKEAVITPHEQPQEEKIDIGLAPIAHEEIKPIANEEIKPVTHDETETENEETHETVEEKPAEVEKTADLSIPQENEIEISFEDDLEEIRNILSMDKEEFNQAIISELKKASEELGIDYNELLNWHDQLIEQIKDEKKPIYKYIEKQDYENLHESYHKLKGAALNLRLSQIAIILKKLDELSKMHENIDKIKAITDDFYKLIENESVNLSENETENGKDKFVENIILTTIKTYLNTQDEAQFQKDKKYIEKLLNTKIESIEDLKKIVKGM